MQEDLNAFAVSPSKVNLELIVVISQKEGAPNYESHELLDFYLILFLCSSLVSEPKMFLHHLTLT